MKRQSLVTALLEIQKWLKQTYGDGAALEIKPEGISLFDSEGTVLLDEAAPEQVAEKYSPR